MADSTSSPSHTSPFLPKFEHFRDELDEHHDRRERVIKASRDVTALSKKIVTKPNETVSGKVEAENRGRKKDIAQLFESTSPDLCGINAYRYHRQISGAIQEYIEAVSFEHYLAHQRLITPQEASTLIPGGIQLTGDDYVLGIFDLVGELMRHAITNMATSGSLPGHSEDVEMDGGEQRPPKRNILVDLRSLRSAFERLNVDGAGFGVSREVEKKMEVMKTCVEKVEAAAYGMMIRGSERPKGWMPDVRTVGEAVLEPVESY
ncbi:MAG: hypothetical protein M1826_001567 [Phylliscum demangeonii]|nr:MAG: hypothetical protein M1826_001567 [Phylliscum demangeonii]